MLAISSRNRKRGGFRNNGRVQVTALNTLNVNPKVTLGFNVIDEKTKPKTWKPLPPANVYNDKDFPMLTSPSPSPDNDNKNKNTSLILSPINQVLGSWSFDSNLPPPEVLLSKVNHQRKEPVVQFDEQNEPLEISIKGLLVATNKVHQNQVILLNELLILKSNNPDDVVFDSSSFKKLHDFVRQSKLLIALCKHVKI